MNQIDTATNVKSEPGDPDSTSRSNRSMTLSVTRSIASFTGSTLTRMLGCVSIYILFLTAGNNSVVQSKFLASHVASISVGAAGCWATIALIFPSSIATCIGEDEEIMFEGYKVWAQNREDSSSNPARKKRFILLESHFASTNFLPVLLHNTTAIATSRGQENNKTQATSPALPTSSPALPSTSPTSSAPSPASLASTGDPSAPKHRYTDPTSEVDESTASTEGTDPPNHGLTPPSDTQMQEKNLDREYFLDATLKIPLATIYKSLTILIIVMMAINVCGCLGLFCQSKTYEKRRMSAPTSPPTFPAMNERTTNESAQVTTWEDALSTRGLGGLGRLETPSPPPFPAHKDAIVV